MAFVNEFVPEEERGRFKDINIWKDPTTGFSIEIYKWTIDRERDIFLMRTGSGGGRPERQDYFGLYWSGDVIKFQGFRDVNRNKEIGPIVSWSIFGLQIPDCLNSKKAEIHQLIKEVLTAYGWLFNGDIVKEVHIEFIRRTFFWQ